MTEVAVGQACVRLDAMEPQAVTLGMDALGSRADSSRPGRGDRAD
jgi:hypothetical protein